jgi:hypothetical protein
MDFVESLARRWSATVPIVLLATAGCGDQKQIAFSTCHTEHLATYVERRPQERPPDEFLLRALSLCMMSHGYRLEADDPACATATTVGSSCFGAATPLTWARELFE